MFVILLQLIILAVYLSGSISHLLSCRYGDHDNSLSYLVPYSILSVSLSLSWSVVTSHLNISNAILIFFG